MPRWNHRPVSALLTRSSIPTKEITIGRIFTPSSLWHIPLESCIQTIGRHGQLFVERKIVVYRLLWISSKRLSQTKTRFDSPREAIGNGGFWRVIKPESKAQNTMTTQSTITKAELCKLLRAFVGQRSGLDWRNYGHDWRDAAGMAALRSDRNTILQHGRDARALLSYVEKWSSIPVDYLLTELSDGKRLSFDASRGSIDYCAGQYFPTEYRAAVCRALSSALWRYQVNLGTSDVRAWAVETFGRGIASRWF